MPARSKPPYELRGEALSTARRAIIKLKSPECLLELRHAPDEVQAQWAKTLLKLDETRDRLEKVPLVKIRDKLKDNEKELREGTKSVSKALETLEHTKQALDAVTAFVNLVAKILALA